MQQRVSLAIVGGRELTDQSLFDGMLDAFIATYGQPDTVVTGGGSGADRMAKKWAEAHSVQMLIIKPQWRSLEDGMYDKAAGIKRNTNIVNACTHMLAFPSKKGKGAEHSIHKARQQGKPVFQIWVY